MTHYGTAPWCVVNVVAHMSRALVGRFGGACQTQPVQDVSRNRANVCRHLLDNDSTLKCLCTPDRVEFAHTLASLRFTRITLVLVLPKRSSLTTAMLHILQPFSIKITLSRHCVKRLDGTASKIKIWWSLSLQTCSALSVLNCRAIQFNNSDTNAKRQLHRHISARALIKKRLSENYYFRIMDIFYDPN